MAFTKELIHAFKPRFGDSIRSMTEFCWSRSSLPGTELKLYLYPQALGPSWYTWSQPHPFLPLQAALSYTPVELQDAQTTVPSAPRPTALLIC